MNKQDRMIEKIKKLFALADDENSQGNESENALRMANKLLEKHALTTMDLGGGNADVRITFKDYDKNWKTIIAESISVLYMCKGFTTNRFGGKKFIIVGTDANRITAEIVMDQLIDQIMKETKGEKIEFKNGAAFGIQDTCNRITEERKSDKTEVMPGTGLMAVDLMKQQELAAQDWLDKNIPNMKKGKRVSYSSAGSAYGSGLNTGARVGGAAQRRLG